MSGPDSGDEFPFPGPHAPGSLLAGSGGTMTPKPTERPLAGPATCPECGASEGEHYLGCEVATKLANDYLQTLTPQPRKADAGKHTMPELLPFVALEQVCAVFAYGARKYEPHNYRKGSGLAWSRLLGAALRHLFAWGRGEDLDSETGLSHLAHAACCCLMLLDGTGTDDRWRQSSSSSRPS